MNPELKDLYRNSLAQKDREIAALKARILELEKELRRASMPGQHEPIGPIATTTAPTITV